MTPSEIADTFVAQRRTGNQSELREVEALRKELAETQKKLQGYADTVISLYNELQTIKENICKSCRSKVALNASVASSAQAAPIPSASFFNRSTRPAKDFWHRILTGKQRSVRNDRSASNVDIPINSVDSVVQSRSFESIPTHIPITLPAETHLIVSEPLLEPSSEAMQNVEPSVPRWFVKQDAVNATISITFVRSFIHEVTVWSVRFSADGKYLAAGLGVHNGLVVVFDVTTGKQICTLAEYASQYSSEARPGIKCVCFCPKSRYLAFGDVAGCVIVWDILNKRTRNIFRGHWNEIESVDFSPNGRLVVSASWDGTVRIWNMRDGSARVFSDEVEEFWCARFSPSGDYVAAGDDDGILRLWDAHSGRLVQKWTGNVGGIRSLAFTPDGKGLLSGSYDVKYWDVSLFCGVLSGRDSIVTEIQSYKLEGHTETDVSNCVSVSSEAQWIASASSDKTVTLWSTRDAVRQCTLIGHDAWVGSVDFSPTGTYLATGGDDGHVTLWKYLST